MAFKVLFSSLVAIAVINSSSAVIVAPDYAAINPAVNPAFNPALNPTLNPYLDQQFAKVKTDLYDLIESLYNLVSDSQKLQDVQKEYLAGNVDFSAVARAQNELNATKNAFMKKYMQYLLDTYAFEPNYNYLYPDLYNPNVVNPVYGNPNVVNPVYGNPNLVNPVYGNPNLVNPVYNPAVATVV